MTQEQQIIEFLEIHGSSFAHVIYKALGLPPCGILQRAIKRGEVKVKMVLSPRKKMLVALYSVADDKPHPFCRHTVKAVQGMAPDVPQELVHFSNPFQINGLQKAIKQKGG